MPTPLSISIGRDHEFRHILWAMHGADHVLFCTVCDATIDVRDNWQAFNQTHRKCAPVTHERLKARCLEICPDFERLTFDAQTRVRDQAIATL